MKACSLRRGCAPTATSAPLRSGGRALDESVRSRFEPRFGVDFSRVRIHADDQAAKSARGFGARAYTAGNHVVFDSGEYSPHTAKGARLLAHELTHVVQQSGRVSQLVSHVDDSAEREADSIGAAAIGEHVHPRIPQSRLTALVARQQAATQRQPATTQERVAALFGVGPVDAITASALSEEAAIASRALAGGAADGPRDAYRHCFWNCRMTAELGAVQASTIATNHETFGAGTPLTNMMDLFNNRVGRDCMGDCDQCCRSNLAAGQLRVIENGVIVRSGGSQPKPVVFPAAAKPLRSIAVPDNTTVVPRGGQR